MPQPVIGFKDDIMVEFPSLLAAANYVGGHRQNLRKCVRGQTKSYHGYNWRYA